jgi:hypothetical protein
MAARVLVFSSLAGAAAAEVDCSTGARDFFTAIFSSLGSDCETYVSLFKDTANYYHQHDGHKVYEELLGNCQGYGSFCPDGKCIFRQDGAALHRAENGQCHFLIPYIWAQTPADDDNLEPHTGWEYVIAERDATAKYGFKMSHFAEIETSYTAALNWQDPSQTPALFETTKALLATTASEGECDNPVAPLLTEFMQRRSVNGSLFRQQGDAVLLAAGGVCQLVVPYAADIARHESHRLESGLFHMTMTSSGDSYTLTAAQRFHRGRSIRFEEDATVMV